MIIQNDRDTLAEYNLQYRSLASAQAEAARNASQLVEVRTALSSGVNGCWRLNSRLTEH